MAASPKSAADIKLEPLPRLSWAPDQREASLEALYEYARGQALAAVDWYLRHKQARKRGARVFRVGAIASVAVAGILPLVSQMWTRPTGQPVVAPAWASVALLVAATLIALDRFYGFSNSWMRFLVAELRLQQMLHELQLDWELDRAARAGQPPNDEQVQQQMQRIKAFVVQTHATVADETKGWVDEFRSVLSQLDEMAKAKPTVSDVGGLNVVVTNGAECEGGWTLSLDGGTPRGYHGTTAALPGLFPSVHLVRVHGRIGGKAVQAETQAGVPAGGVAAVQLTLS